MVIALVGVKFLADVIITDSGKAYLLVQLLGEITVHIRIKKTLVTESANDEVIITLDPIAK